MQEHVGGARRARSQEGADDAARGLRRLEHVGLKPLIQKVCRAHRHQLDERVQPLAPEAAEMLAELEQADEIAGRE